MTIHDQTISKLRQLPEALAQEVNDFIDFLLFKQSSKQWQRSIQFSESTELAEMANDPEIQAEMAAIETEFAATEYDGLPSA
ncbi:MAG: DUF2281 domain-containing protein [Leptolyngbyaceae cyanobacterium SM1_3_5]|nr:DUF2281 domain-containing protein [Leptolyngbyaceae cyanobacterium SM1_3_5]